MNGRTYIFEQNLPVESNVPTTVIEETYKSVEEKEEVEEEIPLIRRRKRQMQIEEGSANQESTTVFENWSSEEFQDLLDESNLQTTIIEESYKIVKEKGEIEEQWLGMRGREGKMQIEEGSANQESIREFKNWSSEELDKAIPDQVI